MRSKSKRKKSGFTLIELVIVILIVGTLLSLVLITLNPSKQINKTWDAQRLNDLGSIQSALDTYYNDTTCYPQTIPFGSSWTSGNTILMAKVPQDPQVSTNGSYVYLTDTSSTCPQWNVVFSKLTTTQTNTNTCSLPPDCVPSGWSTQWACKTSGTVNCKTMLAANLPDLAAILPTQPVQNPLLQFLFGYHQTPTPTPSSGNTCLYDVNKEYPTGQNEMMAHLYSTGGFFMIANAFAATPEKYGAGSRGGSYYIDVSYNSNFSGPTCDANTMYPFDPNNTSRGASCQTFLALGDAYQPLAGTYFANTYNNIAEGNIGSYSLGSVDVVDPSTPGDYWYSAYPPGPGPVTYSGGGEAISIKKFWSNWQCGKTLYWRFRDWNNPSNVSPVHADYISCNLPPQVILHDWIYNYRYSTTNYDNRWDLNCNGKMDLDDGYRLEFMWMIYDDGNQSWPPQPQPQ